MSAADVLSRFGTWALVKFVGALLVFVLLHLVRLPVVLLTVALAAAMARVDHAVTSAVSTTPGSVVGEGIR
jgi:hypothetical protein